MITAADPSIVTEQASPRLTDYENEGYIARRLARSSNENYSEGFKLLAMAKLKQDKEKALKQSNAKKQALEKQAQQAKKKLAKEKLQQEKLRRDKQQQEKQANSDDENALFGLDEAKGCYIQ